MKVLLSFIVTLLLSFSAGAANPDYKAFRGAGIATVTTNPPTGTVVITGQSNVQTMAISAITAGSAVSTNGEFLGAPGTPGTLYSYDIGFVAYRQFLATSPGSFIVGTNGTLIQIRGTGLIPNLDGTTDFGGSANRWKGGWFTGLTSPKYSTVPFDLSYVGTNCTIPAATTQHVRLLMTNNVGFTISGGNDGDDLLLQLTQDGVGFRTAAFTNLFTIGEDSTAPYFTTNGGRTDYFRFKYWAASNRWDFLGSLHRYPNP